ncbi:GAP family protein [Haloferax namakaokahaiae]|uniref:GAP family protein n=1 Tax=Haloferax namakaokahaiae TaxID=1748331 RepID=A0ABD5ZFI1_9EURY
MSSVNVLPLAIVMVAGPQILSSFFFATSERWKATSAAYVLGAILSISLVVTIAFLVIDGPVRQSTSSNTLDYVIVALLVVAMLNTYRTRNTAEPPKWMGKLTTATPRFSFRLGFLLLGVFPTDIITSVSVGAYLSTQNSPLTDAIPFILVTALLLALPALAVLALGKRAEERLPGIRDWMNDNSWIVNEAVLLLFIVIVLT